MARGSIKRARVQALKYLFMFCARRAAKRRGKRSEGEMEGSGLASRVGFQHATEKQREREKREENAGKAFVPTTVFFLTRWKCRGQVHAPLLLDVRSRSPRGERKSRKKRGRRARAINFNWEQQHVDALHNHPLGFVPPFCNFLFRLPCLSFFRLPISRPFPSLFRFSFLFFSSRTIHASPPSSLLVSGSRWHWFRVEKNWEPCAALFSTFFFFFNYDV